MVFPVTVGRAVKILSISVASKLFWSILNCGEVPLEKVELAQSISQDVSSLLPTWEKTPNIEARNVGWLNEVNKWLTNILLYFKY